MLKKYMEEDLFNELRWLLCAATQWDAYERLVAKPFQTPGVAEPCFHLNVYTMDSAFIHARTYTSFSLPRRKQLRKIIREIKKRLTWCDYNLAGRQKSKKYNEFMKPLHGRVMHLDKDRSGYDAVKSEVVNFAKDILELWDGFTKKAGIDKYAELLKKLRDDAIREARHVASQYKNQGYECPFS